jgi:hypothetical protein
MSWRFRKSFKVLPGVRLNVSKSGITTSIGGAPFTINIGSRGVQGTASIPGTGASMRHRFAQPTTTSKIAPGRVPTASAPPSPTSGPVLSPPPAVRPTSADLGEEIRSAGTDMMTSAGLAEFRNLLLQAGKECVALTGEIATVTPRTAVARSRQQRWEHGFLFKRLRKARFAQINEEAETTEAQLDELREQLRLARLTTEIAVEPDIAASYSRLCDTFAAMTQSKRIWDTVTRKATNRVVERTAASESITREPVNFTRGQSDVLSCEWAVPCLENRSGGDMYLYPAFVLYRVTKDSFAVIDVQDVTVEYVPSQFIEREAIPADSSAVGHTWLKVNKDGSPDKRFKDNVPIPIVLYGALKLKSRTGLNEEYLLSNARLSEDFSKAWTAFTKSFTPASKASS